MKERKGISGSTLKIIAIITMLIDHIGAGVLGRLLVVRGMNEAADLNAWIDANSTLVITYQMMRFVGRLAFPIFCFLLIEGFEHTHDVKKYALRLLSFCLVSEIPFDLLFNGKILEFGYQNVFFTLFIGLMVMWGFQVVENQERFAKFKKVIFDAGILAAGILAAEIPTMPELALPASYYSMYFVRKNPTSCLQDVSDFPGSLPHRWHSFRLHFIMENVDFP